tara:strand:+ start:671 stop:1120 length:450 start_codon:yes stop_codon:yes gene_type:complete
MGINFKNIGENSGGSFEALPEDRYNVMVEKADLRTASTGTQMISAQFTVTEGQYKGRKLWNNFTLTPKAYVYLYNFLKAAGSTAVDSDDIDESEVAGKMVGLAASVYVEIKNNNQGNAVNVLSRFSGLDTSSSANATTTTTAKTDELFT